MVEITHHRHFDRSEMKWSEVEKSSYNTNNMKKSIKIFRISLIIISLSIVFASCSRAYEPSNYQKKSKDCDCSRWK